MNSRQRSSSRALSRFSIWYGTLKNEVLCVCTRKKFPVTDTHVYISPVMLLFLRETGIHHLWLSNLTTGHISYLLHCYACTYVMCFNQSINQSIKIHFANRLSSELPFHWGSKDETLLHRLHCRPLKTRHFILNYNSLFFLVTLIYCLYCWKQECIPHDIYNLPTQTLGDVIKMNLSIRH